MTVAERYHAALAAAGHVPDAAQLLAVERLDDLRQRLLRLSPSPASRWRAVLSRMGPGKPSARVSRRGLYLHGGVGRGKTFLMDLFHASLESVPARRVHFNRFMQEVHARLRALGETQNPLEAVAGELAAETRVLCFDELHVNDIADAMILGGLFTALVQGGTTLVFTSNVPPAGLYRDGLQRARFLPAIALLEQHCEILTVDGGQDYRLRELERAPLYLDSRDPLTVDRLRERFAVLAGGIGTPGPLELCGRAVDCLRHGGDVAWFSFAALCEGPRGQADYSELASNFSTVFLQDVPVLGSEQDNAARRLVSLVDEFYDRGVKLVVSAAAAPPALYHGERLAFEFHRTASRLIEMQSHDYLARAHCP
jgi:cell division protein ZapE